MKKKTTKNSSVILYDVYIPIDVYILTIFYMTRLADLKQGNDSKEKTQSILTQHSQHFVFIPET